MDPDCHNCADGNYRAQAPPKLTFSPFGMPFVSPGPDGRTAAWRRSSSPWFRMSPPPPRPPGSNLYREWDCDRDTEPPIDLITKTITVKAQKAPAYTAYSYFVPIIQPQRIDIAERVVGDVGIAVPGLGVSDVDGGRALPDRATASVPEMMIAGGIGSRKTPVLLELRPSSAR